jgi:hypothetical protein
MENRKCCVCLFTPCILRYLAVGTSFHHVSLVEWEVRGTMGYFWSVYCTYCQEFLVLHANYKCLIYMRRSAGLPLLPYVMIVGISTESKASHL